MLEVLHVIDFIPGIEPEDNRMLVELFQEGSAARMVISLEAHVDDEWTAARPGTLSTPETLSFRSSRRVTLSPPKRCAEVAVPKTPVFDRPLADPALLRRLRNAAAVRAAVR